MEPMLDGEDRLRLEIDANLRSGKWRAGARLPTERALSDSFGIARARVRRVLDQFERDGRINRVVGRGTFVVQHGSPEVVSETDFETVSPEDLMEVRLIIEPQLADLLVRRASTADVNRMRDLVKKGRHVTSMAAFEHLDHQFHMALTLAAKNSYLTGVLARIQAVRQSGAWTNIRRRGLTTDRQATYQMHHEQILAALESRDTDGLRKAIHRHLVEVRQNLGL
ncbi:FadR/GntR family transcriptional regulator [Aestuariivita sp.]|uniref:FadR/GntR family transcriptional regulator n=1 Tax=Aestuariivita sp. TaxID=1872407 RepID=UPI003BAE944C